MNAEKIKLAYLLKVKGITGAEKNVLDLCAGLKNEFEIHVVVLEKKDFPQDDYCQQLKDLDVHVHRIFLQKTFSPKTVFAVSSYLKKNQIMVLHTHLMAADFIGYCMKRMLKNISWVSTVHNIHSFLSMKKTVLKIYRRVMKSVDQLIFPTQFLKSKLGDLAQAQRTYVIPHGVSARQKNKIELQNASEIRILFVGRLITLKGTEDLIKAFSFFSVGRRDLFLDVVGDGPEKEALQKLVGELQLEQSVIFHGYQKDVASFYEKAHIFVLPSHTEGLPLSLLEAMSFGLAIVATEITSIPECVSDGISALLVKPHDIFQLSLALKKLVEDSVLRRSLGDEAQRVFEEKFTLEKMITRYRIQYRIC